MNDNKKYYVYEDKKYYVYLAPGNISYFSDYESASAYAAEVNLENNFSGSDLVIPMRYYSR